MMNQTMKWRSLPILPMEATENHFNCPDGTSQDWR